MSYKNTTKELWTSACRYQKLSEDFMRKHKDNLDWVQVSFHQKLSIKFAEEFKNELWWDAVTRNPNISEKFIEYFYLKEDIIRKYIKGNSPETDKTKMGRGAAMQQMWFDLTKYHQFSESFIREHKKHLDWNVISEQYDYLSFDFIREFSDKIIFKYFAKTHNFTIKEITELNDEIDWNAVSEYQYLDEPYIRRNSEKINVTALFKRCKDWKWRKKKKITFSDEFINEMESIFADVDSVVLNNMFVSAYKMTDEQLNKYIKNHNEDVNWDVISHSQKLNDKFIDKYANKLDWSSLSAWQKLTPYIIEKYKKKIDWEQIGLNSAIDDKVFVKYKDKFKTDIINFVSSYRQLTEDVIEGLKLDKITWTKVCEYQTLSEEFIRRHAKEVDWNAICKDQKLSIDFIREFADKLDWEQIGAFQHLSEELIWKYRNKMNLIHAFSHWQKLSEPFIEKLISDSKNE